MKNQKKLYFILALMLIVLFGKLFFSFLSVGSFDPENPFSFDGFFSTENMLFVGTIAILIIAIAFLFPSNKDADETDHKE